MSEKNKTAEAGTKHDQGKPSLAYLPPRAILGIGEAMSYGAKKYGAFNYLGGLKASRLLSACLRHLFARLAGEVKDPESGLPHLYHAGASLCMLIETVERRPELDDVPTEQAVPKHVQSAAACAATPLTWQEKDWIADAVQRHGRDRG